MTDKYEFIDAEYDAAAEAGTAPTIMQMCRWISVSKSGYYEWRSRPESASAARRELLKIKITALFEANDETYGYRRMHAALVRGGEQVSDELVRQLMRELGLVPCQPRPRRSLTAQDAAAGPIPDLVNRDFTANAPGEKMVGDITYIETWEGWLYLATVIDCATRKLVGWAMDDNYKTPLISDAIKMAARNLDLPEGAIFHSDRGSNYTSVEFARVLDELGIRQSVGRTGICFDNAGQSTRHARRRAMTLRGGSSSATIGPVFIQCSDTVPRKRSWTSTSECRQPRELAVNSLSRKRGAAQV